MKILVVCICGDDSLHGNYIPRFSSGFDLFINYYGNRVDQYRGQAKFYENIKGTKFNILAECMERNEGVFSRYDYVFVPDDDIFIGSQDIVNLCMAMGRFNLELAQPGIVGWVGLPDMMAVPNVRVRYTNFVEIMAPCFSSEALQICRNSFRKNQTNWGIDWLWHKLLGSPSDRIGIIDEVIGIHTRPCYYGDTYHNNNTGYEQSNRELWDLLRENGLDGKFVTYSSVPADLFEFGCRASEKKFFPDSGIFKKLVRSLREKDEAFI